MKRTNFVIKLVSAMLFTALAVYLVVYIFTVYTNQYNTVPAISYTVELSYSVDGIIVRDESLITTSHDIVSVTAAEGEKLGVGQAVAYSYESKQAMERSARIAQLELEISELEAGAQNDGSLEDSATLETSIKSSIIDMNSALNGGDIGAVSEIGIALKSRIFSEEGTAQTRLNTLQGELDALKAEVGSSSGGGAVNTDISGIFSSNVDGYEYLSIDALTELSASDILSLKDAEATGDTGAIGKMVSGTTWYFATVVPAGEAEKLREIVSDGSAVLEVFVDRLDSRTITMTIEQVGDEEEDGCVVLLSCDRLLGDTLQTRLTGAEIIYNSYSGLRVSKDAVYTDDEGNTYVYTETGMQAIQRYVEIIYEYGDYCLVKAVDDSSALKAGNNVIVSGKDLYDGKVIN